MRKLAQISGHITRDARKRRERTESYIRDSQRISPKVRNYFRQDLEAGLKDLGDIEEVKVSSQQLQTDLMVEETGHMPAEVRKDQKERLPRFPIGGRRQDHTAGKSAY